MQLILQVVLGAPQDLSRMDASRFIHWIDGGQMATVGRSGARADLAFPEDAKMSSAHFAVHCDVSGCTIRDLRSTNGTMVNGSRITEAVLRDGDMILAGETVFDVRIRGAEADPPQDESVPAGLGGVSGGRENDGAPAPEQDSPIDMVDDDTASGEPGQSEVDNTDVQIHVAVRILDGPFSESEAANLTRLIKWIRPGDMLSFGRTKRSEVAVRQDERMTSLHFELDCNGRRCELRDMGSRNGTFVNELRVEEATLGNGDTIRAGTTTFQVGLVECDAQGRPLDISIPAPESEQQPGSDSADDEVPLEEATTAKQMRVVLTVDDDPSGVHESRVSWFGAGQSVTVGRVASKADLVIDEDSLMSGAHFEVACDGLCCRLRDLESRNSTFVNGQPVDEVVLCNGDRIHAGRTKFSVAVLGSQPQEQTLDFSATPTGFPEEEGEVPVTLPNVDEILGQVISAPGKDSQEPHDPQAIVDRLLPTATSLQERLASGEAVEGAVLKDLDLSGADLRGARLARCTLTNVNLQETQLAGADLRNSVLANCQLKDADLSGADLQGSTWMETSATGANFQRANMNHTTMAVGQAAVMSDEEVEITFTEAKIPSLLLPKLEEQGIRGFAKAPCDLSDADFKACRIENVRWMGVALRQSKLAAAVITESYLGQCDLTGSQWKRTRLESVQFEECFLEDVDLSTSYLKGVQFIGMNLIDAPVLPRVLPHCGFSRCELGARDLSFCNLREADLSGVRLEEVNLTHAQLRGANFQDCQLSGIRLTAVDLTDADFKGAVLDGADLSDSNLTATDFSGASLRGTRLSRSLLKDAALRNTDLHGAALVDTVLDHADLHGATLVDSDLRGARFESVDLSHVDFTKTDLGYTTFAFCRLVSSSFQHMDLSSCVLRGCDLSQSDLNEANLRGTDCRQATFKHAMLSNCNFRSANCEAAKFMGAVAKGADFRQAKLGGANFEGAEVAHCNFEKALLEKSRFVSADCTQAMFVGASLAYADLSQALLNEADFNSADLTQANLHRVRDEATRWSRGQLKAARGTDEDRAAAEQWQPPQPEEPLLPITAGKGS